MDVKQMQMMRKVNRGWKKVDKQELNEVAMAVKNEEKKISKLNKYKVISGKKQVNIRCMKMIKHS